MKHLTRSLVGIAYKVFTAFRSRRTSGLRAAVQQPFLVLVALFTTCCGMEPAIPVTMLVTAEDFQFTPSAVTWPADEPVTVIFKNVGTTLHDFIIIAGPGIPAPQADESDTHSDHEHMGPFHVAAEPNKQASLSLTLATGEYRFICSVAGHRELGMEGTVSVR